VAAWLSLIAIELGYTVVVSSMFVVLYMSRAPWHKSRMGRFWVAYGLTNMIIPGALLLAVAGHTFPVWMYAVAFMAEPLLATHRLWMLLRPEGAPPLRRVLLGRISRSPREGTMDSEETLVFRREPALWLAALSAGLAMLVGFSFPGLNDGVAAAITAVANAGIGAWIALRTRPLAPGAFTGLAAAVATLAAAWGLDWPQQAVGGVSAVIVAFMALLTRQQVRPVSSVPVTDRQFDPEVEDPRRGDGL
jgi:hypothetical protein